MIVDFGVEGREAYKMANDDDNTTGSGMGNNYDDDNTDNDIDEYDDVGFTIGLRRRRCQVGDDVVDIDDSDAPTSVDTFTSENVAMLSSSRRTDGTSGVASSLGSSGTMKKDDDYEGAIATTSATAATTAVAGDRDRDDDDNPVGPSIIPQDPRDRRRQMTDRRSSTMSSMSRSSSTNPAQPSSSSASIAPLSMRLMRPFWSVSCTRCDGRDCDDYRGSSGDVVDDGGGVFFAGNVVRPKSDSSSSSEGGGRPRPRRRPRPARALARVVVGTSSSSAAAHTRPSRRFSSSTPRRVGYTAYPTGSIREY